MAAHSFMSLQFCWPNKIKKVQRSLGTLVGWPLSIKSHWVGHCQLSHIGVGPCQLSHIGVGPCQLSHIGVGPLSINTHAA